MQVTIEDMGNCRKKLIIEVPAEKVTEELEKRTSEYKMTAELKGFRRGHIPEKLFERRFGKKLREAIKGDLTAEAFENAMSEHGLEPLGEPDIPGLEELEIQRDTPLKFEVELIVKPQVKIEDYMGIKVQAEEIEVNDDEIKKTIDQMRRERAELVVVEDRASEEEDMLFIDVELTAEDKTIYESKGSYIGAGSKGIFGIEIPDLVEKLTGKKPGDTVEFDFELPEVSSLGYDKELVGKTAHCRLNINEIKVLKMPEANSKWAKEIGFESLKDLKEKVKTQVTAAKERSRNQYVERKVLDSLHEANDFDVPADLMDTRAHELAEYRRYQLMKSGVEQEKIDADINEYKDFSRKELERNFRDGLILGKIAELENIFVTEDEVQAAIAQIALSRGQSPDALQEEMGSKGLINQLRGDLLDSRVKEFLRDKAEVELLPPGSLSKTEKQEEEQKEEKSEKSGDTKDGEPEKNNKDE